MTLAFQSVHRMTKRRPTGTKVKREMADPLSTLPSVTSCFKCSEFVCILLLHVTHLQLHPSLVHTSLK